MSLQEWAACLKKQRIKHHKTQAMLAELCEVSDAYIAMLEKGKRTPSLEIQRAIQYWLHTPVVCFHCGQKA